MVRIISLFALIASVFIIMIPIQAYALYIDIISQSCGTSGVGYYYDYDAHELNMFNFSDDGTTSALSIDPGGNVIASGTVNAGISNAFVEAQTEVIDNGIAYATLKFRPIGALCINIFAESIISSAGFGDSFVFLIDETTHTSLLKVDSKDNFPNDLYLAYNSSIPVDPTHTYTLGTEVHIGFCENGTARVSMSLVSVPESATMLLLGLCLMGLAGVRRKLKK